MKIVLTPTELDNAIYNALINGLSVLGVHTLFVDDNVETIDRAMEILRNNETLNFYHVNDMKTYSASFNLIQARERIEALTENHDIVIKMLSKEQFFSGVECANFLQICLYGEIKLR